MNILIIDPQQSGISGDMLVAALTDLFQAQEAANKFFNLVISSTEEIEAIYTTKKVTKSNINGTILNFDIHRDIANDSVKEFLDLLENIFKKIGLSEKSEIFVRKVFDVIVKSEAWVHGFNDSETNKMHFHELQSIDSIIDVLTVAYIIENFYSWDKPILGLPVSNGTGEITFSHGEFSLPAPAVAKILELNSYPNFHIQLPFELTTVTGIAELTTLVTETVFNYPLHTKIKIGLGHGQRDLGKRANFLRVELVNILKNNNENSTMVDDEIAVLETHLDDVSGEILGNIFDDFQSDPDVLDISIYSLIMKKNRPGQCVRILCNLKSKHKISEKLIKYTGTLGVRIYPVQRHIAIKEIKTETLSFMGNKYEIKIKISKIGEKIVNIKPEFDDIKLISKKTGKSIKEIKEFVESHIQKSIE